MQQIRIADAARFLGVSDDTVRRWISSGRIPEHLDDGGRKCVAGSDLAVLAQELAQDRPDPSSRDSSARNRFVGLVTAVTADKVMAQVELQCGPFRVVSLMSTEAVGDLGLEPGSVAVAVIKSTNVVVERLEGMP
ncbi:TOBE domain-containing protein [Nocardioides alcanivorans]|uniref:TOBE domain-containing protein n=1 Tax=Nocardioides alcanivorans TaxID=2897352 RepID=UPI001F33F700|nr:TOBE domain-containing protein [Nocardioides alcanivorans]